MALVHSAKRISLKASLMAGACAAGVAFAPAGAGAQDAPGAAGRSDEIVVTARRRAESLQDVPVAVSAFSDDRIAELQADNLSGLQYATPNLYLDQGDASNAVIYLRGVGQNDSLAFADPGVGVYVDDVFIARSQAAFLELFDVERVEVLRGPQGTLYGRNTIGGAVKFVSTTPPDEFDAYFEAGAGNYDFATVKGRIGGPLAPGVLRGKAAFSASRRDGYNVNLFDGEDDGDLKSFSGRGALLYTPSDDFEFLLSLDGKIDRPDTSRSPVRETAIAGAPDPVGAPATIVVFPQSGDPYEVDVNANGLSDLTAFGVSLTSRWNASETVTIESISSVRTMDFDLNLDTDGAPLPILDILLLQDQTQFSQELRALYDDGGRFTFTGGFYYFHDDDVTFSGVDNGSATIFGFPVILFGFPSSSLAETKQITNSYAVFGDATFALTDRLNVSAGVRYTYEKRKSRRLFENFFDPSVSVIENAPPFLEGAGVPGTPISGEADFDALTPKVSVSYKPTDDILVYASVSRGFKSGGFDGRATTDFGFQPFDPEFVWSYEGGLKTSWFDGAVTANLAYFYNDYADMQVTSFGADPVTGVFVSLFTNAAAATIQGVELELFLQPTARLSIAGTAGWLDAEYDEFEILVGGVPTDVSDRPLVNSPRWNASLGATYEHPLGERFIAVAHVDGAYRGERAVEITASPELTQKRHGLLNAFVALKTADARWELRGGVKNATNEAIRVQGFNLSEFPGVQLGFYAAPRTYDFRLIYRY
ncbi:TonB-dependent receptor [Amphiplicatus metriothermophilus]|uniref:Iron complex outermembrane recepter protein n=1 Tax=Amphiplicatus metriothermophilus TaxID=1519374 RepID=A0A239PKG7_9PROT|nr:TonB-dependent receptor [Amphiplicatus metriothermophilus]MBB5517353.1 iron complex outermembrane receptor protein [Amphiplicatus metriothermophilus]SNT68311.1 iron complex outermembrane recepter protein [Amphiplicatus metriothermophilus]